MHTDIDKIAVIMVSDVSKCWQGKEKINIMKLLRVIIRDLTFLQD